jgi:hypothetical protein
LLHRANLWVRRRRHGESDSLVVVDAGVDDDRALNSSHFDDVNYHPFNGEH